MAKKEDPDKEFWKYVDIGNTLPPQTADNMLIAYAYYKQATEGDNEEPRPQESSNVIQTFKHDAWKRLRGMPKQKAKQNYINIIKQLEKEQS
ncbi:MAG: acyl-CoA-binding protein [Owenweeksia sp.]|nr:acyl-CoA-binding protein [Owenweeksia sp.]